MMPEKDPNTWSWITYLWIAGWSAIAGLVNFHHKVKQGATRWLNLSELVGELATSAFVGLTTGLFCQWAGMGLPATFALVGITGHMGGRAIFWIEKAAQAYAEKRLGISTRNDNPPQG